MPSRSRTGLLPWVQWLVADHIAERGWTVTASVGLWGRSVLAGAVANLAAICTWGDWRDPPPPPSQIDGTEPSRQWRRSLQRSAARKAIARGALTGVHVLDINPRPATAPEEPDTTDHPPDAGTGRRPRAHWRAGHWQNYRIATRDPAGTITGSTRGERDHDWHYEGRWVRPVLVNAHPDGATTPTVYRVHLTTAQPAGPP